ncbi:siderophore-interacting protein [Rhodococcus sp. NPDC058505]|uniref:siderophore-interacting protein n=1 Tax=unclassified Rhodococcus (in: high G+C Gram-positive bacteria) TaxID=192944 RepID=UPI0036676929
MARRPTYIRPDQRAFLRAQVVASKQISPHFVRVTVGGPELRSFTPLGSDQWFRMFLPAPGTGLRLPTATGKLWYAQYLAMSKATRPVVRNYTVRAFRNAEQARHGADPEIDIDFVCHGDDNASGPASAWSQSAAPGDEVALLDEGLIHHPRPDARRWLLVGDESALPAIAGILESAPADVRGETYLEVPHADDAQDLPAPDGMTVHWLARSDPHARPGTLALDAVRAAALADVPDYAFVAGEQALATGVRRTLVNDRGVAKADIAFTGFWRHGRAAG